eukprot:TRINITY_DN16558_c0_g3_i1.p1 TRINITY_DN16558_c0_g3~~TRINITY_DN16558_c0_g3_i1.p1  ORF type:complete len:387 (-),score=29.42 TRINITY_DN16558_c0_g3_i1:570-1730(-)
MSNHLALFRLLLLCIFQATCANINLQLLPIPEEYQYQDSQIQGQDSHQQSVSIESNYFEHADQAVDSVKSVPVTHYTSSCPTVVDEIQQTDVLGFFESRFVSRGEWFNVQDWAAATNMCTGNATTVACMSCSMNMPKFALQEKIAPFGVSDFLWAYPEAGATCGMCLKVYLPSEDVLVQCDDVKSKPNCIGSGSAPYSSFSTAPWAWESPLYFDPDLSLNYIIGIVVEWYDLDVPLPYGISYLTQGQDTQGFGSWPVQISAIECPVGKHAMEYAFISLGSLTQNIYNKKLQIAGNRMPILSVEIYLGNNWYTMKRTGNDDDGDYPDGDGHWMSPAGVFHNPRTPLSLRIWCAGSSETVLENALVPNDMMCEYQDPKCIRFVGTAQC